MEVFGKQCKYINEGNVHIVLEVVGTDYVLRLIKQDGQQINVNDVRDSVNFVNLVMIPLLNNNFQCKEVIVTMAEEEASRLSHALYHIRPTHRHFKSILSQYAIRAPNLALVSPLCETNYCVEIKPKEGFISKSLCAHSKCYFCLKQYLKVETNKVEKHSSYCPLDLFSGDKYRMRDALLHLIENPQNNFKLFKNGVVIYDDKSDLKTFHNIIERINIFGTTDGFLNFIIQLLLADDFSSDLDLKETKASVKYFKIQKRNECVDDSILTSNTFLYKLLELQKLGDSVNFDVTNYLKHEDGGYVSMIIENAANLNLGEAKDKEHLFKNLEPVHRALIAAVARDCSIMISFSPNYVENIPCVQKKEHKIMYRVSVTDLEPKSIKNLVKRKETESEMIEIYQRYMKQK